MPARNVTGAVFRNVLLIVLVLLPSACGGVRPPPSPPVEASVREQIRQEDGIPWRADRPLAWGDFQAAAPGGGAEGALTGYSLLYAVECAGATFRYEAAAVFLPHKSWVRAVVLADPGESERTLDHEQTHFNLTEVYARRLRRFLQQAYDPCGHGADAVRQGSDRIVADEADAQRRYDDETRHGLNLARQHAWHADIKGWLADLDSFAASTGTRPAR